MYFCVGMYVDNDCHIKLLWISQWFKSQTFVEKKQVTHILCICTEWIKESTQLANTSPARDWISVKLFGSRREKRISVTRAATQVAHKSAWEEEGENERQEGEEGTWGTYGPPHCLHVRFVSDVVIPVSCHSLTRERTQQTRDWFASLFCSRLTFYYPSTKWWSRSSVFTRRQDFLQGNCVTDFNRYNVLFPQCGTSIPSSALMLESKVMIWMQKKDDLTNVERFSHVSRTTEP